MGRVKRSGERKEKTAYVFPLLRSPSPLSSFRPCTCPKGYYFYSPQSSTDKKSKMGATTMRTRTRFCPPKIRLHCRLAPQTKLNSGWVRLRNIAEILDLGPHLCTRNLITRHDWPVKKAIVDLQIKTKGNSRRDSRNWLSPLGAQNKDISAASQTLLTQVKLRLRRRLGTLGTRFCLAWRDKNSCVELGNGRTV